MVVSWSWNIQLGGGLGKSDLYIVWLIRAGLIIIILTIPIWKTGGFNWFWQREDSKLSTEVKKEMKKCTFYRSDPFRQLSWLKKGTISDDSYFSTFFYHPDWAGIWWQVIHLSISSATDYFILQANPCKKWKCQARNSTSNIKYNNYINPALCLCLLQIRTH